MNVRRLLFSQAALLVGLVCFGTCSVAQEDLQEDVLNNFVYGDDVRAVERLKRTVENDCFQDIKCAFEEVWSFIDVTGDGYLSLAEISRFQRVIIKYWVVEQEQLEVNVEDVAGVNLASILLLPITASSILHSFDYDNDGVLSPEEVLGDSEFAKLVGVDAESFAAGIDFEGLGEKLRNSLQLLPLLLQ